MDPRPLKIPAQKIIVVMPNWLGDAVMATPFLRALRKLYPDAYIAALARPLVAAVLAGLPYKAGDDIAGPPRYKADDGIAGSERSSDSTRSLINDIKLTQKSPTRETLAWLRSQPFDLGILLPNSFRSAWLLWRGNVRARLGYARDRRSLFLTHRLQPVLRTAEQRSLDHQRSQSIRTLSRELGEPAKNKVGSPYQPLPTIEYYLKLAAFLGAATDNKHLELAITPREQSEADAALASVGISPDDPVITIVPGANFGSSKCWPPQRFAQLADRLMDRIGKGGDFGAHVLLASSPAELPIVEAIMAGSLLCPGGGVNGGIGRLHALATMNGGKGLSIGALKAIVKRSRLMVCNDTGPRHFAAAFNVPTVTLFGPTDPVWAETFSPCERIVKIDVPCGPCQLKSCPIDHRCMKGITVQMVLDAARELWEAAAPEPDVNPRLEEAG